MINIRNMLAPLREKKIKDLEDLAHRLHAGETIAKEVIASMLKEAEQPQEYLQDLCDRLTRQAELAVVIRKAHGVEPKLSKIQAEIDAADREFEAARQKHEDFLEARSGEVGRLKRILAEAHNARSELLKPENITAAQLERIRQAEQEACDADSAVLRAKHQEPLLGSDCNSARQLVKQAADPRMHNPDDGFGNPMNEEQANALYEKRRAALEECRASIPKLEAAWEAAVAKRQATYQAVTDEVLKVVGVKS